MTINHRVHLVCDTCDEMEIEFGASNVDDLDMLDVEPGDDCLNCGGTLVRKSDQEPSLVPPPNVCPHCGSEEEFVHMDVATYHCENCGIYAAWNGEDSEWELVDYDQQTDREEWEELRQSVENSPEGLKTKSTGNHTTR